MLARFPHEQGLDVIHGYLILSRCCHCLLIMICLRYPVHCIPPDGLLVRYIDNYHDFHDHSSEKLGSNSDDYSLAQHSTLSLQETWTWGSNSMIASGERRDIGRSPSK